MLFKMYRDLYPCPISSPIVEKGLCLYVRSYEGDNWVIDLETAVTQFKKAGFAEESIGVMAKGHLVKDRLPDEPKAVDVVEKAGIGMALGATAGGLISFLTAGIAMTMPVLGPIFAAGSLVPMVTAGAVYGGLSNVFLGLDVPEEEAQFYVDQLTEGAVMVFVNTADERVAEACRLMCQLQPLCPSTTQLEAG